MNSSDWYELYHHGIKVQHWGERRWQNPDGSLTPEGYVHYGYVKNGKLTRRGKQYENRRSDSYDIASTMVGEAYRRNTKSYIPSTKRYANQYALDATQEASKIRPTRILKSAAAGSAAAGIGLAVGLGPVGVGIGMLYGIGTRSSLIDKAVDKNSPQIQELKKKGEDCIAKVFTTSGSLEKADAEWKKWMDIYAAKQVVEDTNTARAIRDVKYNGKKREVAAVTYKTQAGIKHSLIDDDFLAHFGIPGQKKGVRRYQNKDGSLTPEGREHYGINSKHAEVKKLFQKDGYNVDTPAYINKYNSEPSSRSDIEKKISSKEHGDFTIGTSIYHDYDEIPNNEKAEKILNTMKKAEKNVNVIEKTARNAISKELGKYASDWEMSEEDLPKKLKGKLSYISVNDDGYGEIWFNDGKKNSLDIFGGHTLSCEYDFNKNKAYNPSVNG